MKTRLKATILATFVLVGCGEDEPATAPPAPRAPAPAAAATAGTSEPLRPRIVTLVPYAYTPMGKRDPFRSPIEEVRESNSACTDPLCQWELDQLSLVAVVTGDSNPFAMVEDPQGRGHIVHRNSPLGKQGGKLTQILRDSITVTEYWRGPDGKLSPNPVSLQLRGEKAVLTAQDLATGRDL